MPKPLYKLHATRVDRIAIVDQPAVPDAQMVIFKRFPEQDIEKGATSYQDLPLADRNRAWDSGQARNRVTNWAKSGDEIDFAKFRKAFMWYDSQDAEKLGSYKLQYADIIDGTLKAIPRAIIAIVSVLAGGRGGVDIPMEDKKKVLNHAKRYYAKMDLDFPEVTIKVCEKQLQTGVIASFLLKATQGAVDALQEEVLNTIYREDGVEKVGKAIDKAFADFSSIVKNVLTKVLTQSQKQVDAEGSKLTKKDVAQAFARGIGLVAISETFSYFRNNLAYLMMGYEDLAEPETTLEEVIKLFKEFVKNNFTQIVENKRDESDVLEKEGRIISSERLRRLKASLQIIAELIQEAESRYEKSEKEEIGMELKELIEQFNKFSADVNGVIESFKSEVALLTKAMKDAGFLKTEAEIKGAEEARIQAEKKAQEEKVQAEEKAKAEKAEAEKLDLEKRRKDLGLEDSATKEDIEKKEKEIADAKAKFAIELPAKIEKMEAMLDGFKKITEVLKTRFGIKASIQEETVTDKKTSDPFGDALKGK